MLLCILRFCFAETVVLVVLHLGLRGGGGATLGLRGITRLFSVWGCEGGGRPFKFQLSGLFFPGSKGAEGNPQNLPPEGRVCSRRDGASESSHFEKLGET